MYDDIKLVGRTYDYDYADDEQKWELVVYDEKSEEWNCTGIYCDNEYYAYELKELLNKEK